MTASYRAYVSDTLMLQGERKYIGRRWADTIDPPPAPEVEDGRSCGEFAAALWERIKG